MVLVSKDAGSFRPRPVPPDIYDREYYLHRRQGANEFVASGGEVLSPLHRSLLELAAPAPGRRILDVGCGCGELTIHAARHGAEAVGIDYSSDAIALAKEAAARLGAANATFLHRDVSALPEGPFDAVILADIVEHLHQWQLETLYSDLRERLAPNGRVVIHTWPNRLHTEWTYPVARNLLRLFGIRKPRNPRKPHDEIVHVNEQTLFSLRRDLRRAGFSVRTWTDHPTPPEAGMIYRIVHHAPVLRIFFADHLFALAFPLSAGHGFSRNSPK